MRTLIAAPTYQRAVDTSKDLGIPRENWEFADVRFAPVPFLSAHIILAGLDLNEHPSLHHSVLSARARGGTVVIENV